MCRPASQQLFIWPSFIIVTNERRYNAFTDKQLIHRQTHRYSLVQIRPLSIPHHNKQATCTTTANRRWHIVNYRWHITNYRWHIINFRRHIINYRWHIINCGHLNPKQPVSWAKVVDRCSLRSMDSQQSSLCRRHSFLTTCTFRLKTSSSSTNLDSLVHAHQAVVIL